MRHLEHDAQADAVERLQRRVWRAVVERFQQRQALGLRQADLARLLGISRPQINVWLNDPTTMTLKAAARLMLAMDTQLELPREPCEATPSQSQDGGLCPLA
jgi:transcriptional regulator with XRE-family HTH domain